METLAISFLESPSVRTLTEEVIQSAGRIFTVIGLSQEQIRDVFQNAARSIEVVESEDFVENDDPGNGGNGVSRTDDQNVRSLISNFNNQSWAKELQRLGKLLYSLSALENPRTNQRVLVMIEEAISLRLEALDWVKQKAEERGLEAQPVYSA